MGDLEKAVREWRDARRVFFTVPPISLNPQERFPPEIWTRLGNAENRLMRLAEQLDLDDDQRI